MNQDIEYMIFAPPHTQSRYIYGFMWRHRECVSNVYSHPPFLKPQMKMG